MGDVGLRILLAEVFPYATEPNLIPLVSAGRDIEQVDVERIAFDQRHELVEGYQVSLIERGGESDVFHGCQVLERYILWNGQDRHRAWHTI